MEVERFTMWPYARWLSKASWYVLQAEDGIRGTSVTGVQTCALPISCPGSDSCIEMSSSQTVLGLIFPKLISNSTGMETDATYENLMAVAVVPTVAEPLE